MHMYKLFYMLNILIISLSEAVAPTTTAITVTDTISIEMTTIPIPTGMLCKYDIDHV